MSRSQVNGAVLRWVCVGRVSGTESKVIIVSDGMQLPSSKIILAAFCDPKNIFLNLPLPVRNHWSGLGTLLFFFHCVQTRKSDQATTQSALFRGGERVRVALHYSCSLCKTVWERKRCLWFKARANRMGDRALCLLSAVRLECKAVGMKGVFSWRCMNTDVYLKNVWIAFIQMNESHPSIPFCRNLVQNHRPH